MDNHEIILAWQEAFCLRTCPPDKIFNEKDMNVRKHIQACPFCRERSKEAEPEWSSLGDKILEYFPLPDPQSRIAPGQVWTISDKLAGWQEDKHYNPPQVLVYDLTDEYVVQTVQIYGDTALMGPDDVLLGEFGFAETWNTYALNRNDLGNFIGSVGERHLQRTKERIEKKDFKHIDENSTLYQFRLLELETGSFFSSQSISGLLPQTPSAQLTELFPSGETVNQVLEEKYPRGETAVAEDPLLALALFQLPQEKLNMAASSTGDIHPVNWVKTGSGDLSITGSGARIILNKYREGTILVSGTLNDQIPHTCDFLAWWSTFSGHRIPARETDLDPDTGEFDIEITDVSREEYKNGNVILLVLEQKDD